MMASGVVVCVVDGCRWALLVPSEWDAMSYLCRHLAMVHPAEFEAMTGDDPVAMLAEYDLYEQSHARLVERRPTADEYGRIMRGEA